MSSTVLYPPVPCVFLRSSARNGVHLTTTTEIAFYAEIPDTIDPMTIQALPPGITRVKATVGWTRGTLTSKTSGVCTDFTAKVCATTAQLYCSTYAMPYHSL